MRIHGQILSIVVLTATAALAHAEDAARKEPKTGKSCVIFLSSENTDAGRVRMNYRNICATPFQIRIQAGEGTREGSIEPGSPEKPSKAYVTCRPDDRCEVAKWQYQTSTP